MEEKIGKVILDTTCYPGKDLYSDGAIEDEMLAISRDFAPEEFNRVISERESWPILYHFSHIRENILSFLLQEMRRFWKSVPDAELLQGHSARKQKRLPALNFP